MSHILILLRVGSKLASGVLVKHLLHGRDLTGASILLERVEEGLDLLHECRLLLACQECSHFFCRVPLVNESINLAK